MLQTILTRALQLALALPYYTEHINTQTQTDKKIQQISGIGTMGTGGTLYHQVQDL